VTGASIIVWTVRLALLCWTAAATLLFSRRAQSHFSIYRGLWTSGVLLFLAHVIAAFHYVHSWSHREAVLDTARQTEELIGWRFGEGLWFSYLFVVVWVLNVLSLWIAPERSRNRLYSTQHQILHAYLWFIAFNGAVIFENGVTRYPGLLISLALCAMLARRYKLRSR
jgi:membrane protease YdiL (CAAX protease family)